MILFLLPSPEPFKNSCAIETSLSHFHSMTLTVMKKSFLKYKPRITKFRNCKHFRNNASRDDLSFKLVNPNIKTSSFNDAVDKSYFPTALKQANITPVFKKGDP